MTCQIAGWRAPQTGTLTAPVMGRKTWFPSAFTGERLEAFVTDVQHLPLDDWGANVHEHCQNLQDGIRDLMHKHFKTPLKRK
eukprot:3093509-Prorocentrum_lima.AAC.1